MREPEGLNAREENANGQSTYCTPPSGSLGDPLLASAEKGERIVQRAVEGLVRFMSWFKGINPCVEPG
jgi:creatinine amidohydrolase/Fe(II)-dependent formamide hydrolase-like protein